jgi:hypothetical protein
MISQDTTHSWYQMVNIMARTESTGSLTRTVTPLQSGLPLSLSKIALGEKFSEFVDVADPFIQADGIWVVLVNDPVDSVRAMMFTI